ncbi:copia protein [Tanacetum coccineum]
MADTQAEIILSQGLPRHIFNNLNQTSTAKEIWDNVEMLMQGSGRTIQQRKEDLFDEYERFRAIGNESIHDYFVRFHKLVNDMKITQLNIPTHQMNTKFVNNLPAYWGKYVTNVKQNMDISTTPYVQIYTHLKAYEPHAKKTLKKQEQSTSIVDPLAYVAHTTSAPALSSPSTPSPQPTAQSPNDALMATMTQIANLLSGFQKQFPPTNNQLRTSSNSRTHATVHDGHIVTEPVQRKAPGNNGNTGTRGKKVICYNCRGEGHVARQCKEPKRKMDSQYFKDKALLMEAKEKGDASYAAVAFHGNLSSTSAITIQSMGGHSMTIKSFIMWLSDSCDAPGKKHLDFDAETEIDGTIRFRIIRKEKSIVFLQSEKEKILSEKKDLADSYLDEIVCLKTANKVARDMLQRFNMPTQTNNFFFYYMLSKKPKKATNDLHKDILGTRNPGLGYMAKRAQPVLYDADTLLHPNHHPVSIWDSEEVLVHQVVSMKKMNEKPGHVRPANDFYAKLNALMFVPQKELSGDQAYWLSANEIASQASKSATPGTPFVRKSRPPSKFASGPSKS